MERTACEKKKHKRRYGKNAEKTPDKLFLVPSDTVFAPRQWVNGNCAQGRPNSFGTRVTGIALSGTDIPSVSITGKRWMDGQVYIPTSSTISSP